jgi:hypothetical protein
MGSLGKMILNAVCPLNRIYDKPTGLTSSWTKLFPSLRAKWGGGFEALQFKRGTNMKILTLMLIAASKVLVGCGDSSGSGGSSLAGSTGDSVLWSTEDIMLQREACVEGNTSNLGSKAPAWCLCMVETVSKRWSLEDFERAPIEKFEALVADGSAEKCNQLAGLSVWTSYEISSTRLNCVNAALDMYPSMYSKYTNVTLFCGCMIEDASKRWSYNDYAMNEFAYSEQQKYDGTFQSCKEISGL